MDLRIGITGAGHTSRRNATRLIEGFLENHADDRITFIIDFSADKDGNINPAAAWISAWALAQDYAVEGFTLVGGTSADLGDLSGEMKLQAVANPPAAVVRQSSVVLIAWDDQEDAMRALLAAEKHGVPAYDLTEGLLPLGFEDAEDPDISEEVIDTSTKADAPPFDPITPACPAEPTSSVRTVSEEIPGAPAQAPPTLSADDLDRLGQALATYVIEAIKPLLPVKRGPGRPRKTPIEG